MKLLIIFFVVRICFPSVVLAQTTQLSCHRCYGNSYCNDRSHPDFDTNIRNATCNIPSSTDFETDDPIFSQIQKAIDQNVLNDLGDDQISTHNTTVQGNCITATVHEPHDSHTLRTCVLRTVAAGNNQTLCELLHTIIQPMNMYNGTFTCRECNGTHFCNNHTLSIEDGVTPGPGASNMVSASFGVIATILAVYRLL